MPTGECDLRVRRTSREAKVEVGPTVARGDEPVRFPRFSLPAICEVVDPTSARLPVENRPWNPEAESAPWASGPRRVYQMRRGDPKAFLALARATPKIHREASPQRFKNELLTTKSRTPVANLRPGEFRREKSVVDRPETEVSLNRFAIVTASDRAADGTYEDRSGPAAEATLARWIRSDYEVVRRIVPDDRERLERALTDLSEQCDWIIVTGGTGPARRDVTPEAVRAVAEKELPGLGERMRAAAPPQLATAMLSRQLGAIRGRTLIVCVPGNPKAVGECLDAIFPAVPHCLELIGAAKPRIEGEPEVPH